MQFGNIKIEKKYDETFTACVYIICGYDYLHFKAKLDKYLIGLTAVSIYFHTCTKKKKNNNFNIKPILNLRFNKLI